MFSTVAERLRNILVARAAIAGLAMALLPGTAYAADIAVLSDGALRSALTEIAERFRSWWKSWLRSSAPHRR